MQHQQIIFRDISNGHLSMNLKKKKKKRQSQYMK